MPLYMDHHKNQEGLTAEAVAADHHGEGPGSKLGPSLHIALWRSSSEGRMLCE